MKHVVTVTKHVPSAADQLQDFVCYTAQALAGLARSKGGLDPFASYIEEKCDIPEPQE